jgi:hypothetical protein
MTIARILVLGIVVTFLSAAATVALDPVYAAGDPQTGEPVTPPESAPTPKAFSGDPNGKDASGGKNSADKNGDDDKLGGKLRSK